MYLSRTSVFLLGYLIYDLCIWMVHWMLLLYYYYLLSCLFIIHSYLFVWLLYSLFEIIECCLPLINLSLKAFVWFPVFRNNTAYFGIYYWKAKWTMTLQLKTVTPVTRTSLFFLRVYWRMLWYCSFKPGKHCTVLNCPRGKTGDFWLATIVSRCQSFIWDSRESCSVFRALWVWWCLIINHPD